MEVIALKLVTGEDVLGEVESKSETELVIVNPVGIAVVRGPDGKPQVGFSPFPIHSEQKPDAVVAFAHKHVVYSYVPAKDFIDNYSSIFGSGIVLPPEKKLITG